MLGSLFGGAVGVITAKTRGTMINSSWRPEEEQKRIISTIQGMRRTGGLFSPLKRWRLLRWQMLKSFEKALKT